MKKIMILFLILFFSLIYSATSLKVFKINETEKLSLELKVEDPDGDPLTYTFTAPLDKNGEWQTTYGDAGEYTATITVSDGVNEVSEEVAIIVNRKESKPIIDSFEPENEKVTIDEGRNIGFKVLASDLNNDELTYEWIVNDELISNEKELLLSIGYEDAGDYDVLVKIKDGIFDVNKSWNLKINDFDVETLLKQIIDVAVLETETVSLEIPDLGLYGLSYSISDPIGNDNEWKTTYDDAGEYVVTINVEGKGVKGKKEVKIIVRNIDRAPKFVGLRNAKAKENEVISMELKAEDPDNDKISFSAENVPEGAKLEGNLFTWTPSYDFVEKSNTIHYVLDRFNLLKKSVDIDFKAKGNELSDEKKIKISVRNANRPFDLEEIDDIEVSEGEEIVIEPSYSDPDNDKVSFSYSGFMNKNRRMTDFDDAGSYVVKVTAADGFFTETRFVNADINDVNRKPVFGEIKNLEVGEGEEVRIELSATDPDNDAVSFSAVKLPRGAKILDNLFIWKPDFDTVFGTEKEVGVEFLASDGKDEDSKKIIVKVFNVNRAPKIFNTSNNLIAFKNEPVLFEVNALDEDGDELTYEWDFGFFDKFEESNTHQRVFTTRGSKKVEVTVSDGLESVSKVWNVEVI